MPKVESPQSRDSFSHDSKLSPTLIRVTKRFFYCTLCPAIVASGFGVAVQRLCNIAEFPQSGLPPWLRHCFWNFCLFRCSRTKNDTPAWSRACFADKSLNSPFWPLIWRAFSHRNNQIHWRPIKWRRVAFCRVLLGFIALVFGESSLHRAWEYVPTFVMGLGRLAWAAFDATVHLLSNWYLAEWNNHRSPLYLNRFCAQFTGMRNLQRFMGFWWCPRLTEFCQTNFQQTLKKLGYQTLLMWTRLINFRF